MTEIDSRAECDALYSEMLAPRAERFTSRKAIEIVGPFSKKIVTNVIDYAGTIASEIPTFINGVMSHPLTTVLGGLVLGVLIGRIHH